MSTHSKDLLRRERIEMLPQHYRLSEASPPTRAGLTSRISRHESIRIDEDCFVERVEDLMEEELGVSLRTLEIRMG